MKELRDNLTKVKKSPSQKEEERNNKRKKAMLKFFNPPKGVALPSYMFKLRKII